MFQNPSISGFNPDPSLCRVEDDYYLVTSTFEYFPGIPIYKSRDLVHWEQIGNVLDRPEQLDLDGARAPGGLYAASIRYHDGLFYVTCTNMTRGGNFVVTARDPAGPWSNPHFLDTDGFDPCLFFDDDGRAYYVGQHVRKEKRYHGDCEIYLQPFDTEALQVTGEPVAVWRGALKHSIWAEGPHLYKMFGYYYLMIAEGGTGFDHSVTVARSESLFGPYVGCTRNPILTHRHFGQEYAIVDVGHADLVQTPKGEWWMTALGCRTMDGPFCNLGRETLLAKVDWDRYLWPVVNKGVGCVPEVMDVSPDLEEALVAEPPVREDFRGERLPFRWITARTPRDSFYSLLRPGLRLYAKKTCVEDTEHFSFWGQRVRHKSFAARTAFVLKNAGSHEKAGIVVLQQNKHYFELAVGNGEITLTAVEKEKRSVVRKPCSLDKVYLTVEARGQSYSFYYGANETEREPLALDVDGRLLSQERAASFTGTVIGMFVSSYGADTEAYADFDWFDYEGV
ncbi:MAG: glycoside hydrolase family 43 protein [Clostridia bacterium]|nr:glycoside hydrolase family 43 protein [Clostridia bacterium]